MVFISVLDYERLRDQERGDQNKHRNNLRAELRAERTREIEKLQKQITPNTQGMEELKDRLKRVEEQTTTLDGEMKEIKADLASVEGAHAWIDKLMTPLIGNLDIGPESRIRLIEIYLEKLKEDVGPSSGEP